MSNSNTQEQPFRKTVGFMMVSYWAVLVAWQNISGAEVRGSADILVKIGLIAYFAWFFLKRAKVVSVKILWVLLLAACLIITAFQETAFPLSNVIAYAYPVIFLTMVYGLGDQYEINREHLLCFCKWVIGITLYTAIYAMVYQRDYFIGILSVSKAYGNELSSFFISSHEYGMYLACAMISCGICLRWENHLTIVKKIYYIAILAILGLNLILTFSRTSMAGLAVFLLVFILTGKGRLKRWTLAVLVLGAVVVALSPKLADYIFTIVMKENNLASRAELISGGIQYYLEGSWLQKLFGYGIYDTRIYFEYYLNHGSVHNAYLQVLLYYGIVGLVFFVVFLLSQVLRSVNLIHQDRFLGSVSLGLNCMALLMMFTNTAMVFNSPIDSYFLTVYMFVMPRYVGNAIKNNGFY